MNLLTQNGEYRADCFDSNNNFERLWKGVSTYKWGQKLSSTVVSSTNLDGSVSYEVLQNNFNWFGLSSGVSEQDVVLTSHSGDHWACGGLSAPGGEGMLQVSLPISMCQTHS